MTGLVYQHCIKRIDDLLAAFESAPVFLRIWKALVIAILAVQGLMRSYSETENFNTHMEPL